MNSKLSYKYSFFLWAFFCLISFSIGYHSVNSFISQSIPEYADAFVYLNITKYGTEGITTDPRSSRVLIPLISHAIFSVLPAKIGTWDSAAFSLLILNIAFCALCGVLIFHITINLKKNAQLALLASLLFFLNFAVPNYYLSSLVDVSECFYFLILFLCLKNKKYPWILILAIIGTASKETFFPAAAVFMTGWFGYEYYETKKINKSHILYILGFCLASSIMIFIIKSYIHGELYFPWNVAKRWYKPWPDFSFFRVIDEIRRFLYVFIWLLPLGIARINTLPKRWFFSSTLAASVIIALSMWSGASGAAISRYLYNIVGPILCISSAIFISELNSKFTSGIISNDCTQTNKLS